MQNIGNVVHFDSAYYGALGGIERAQLVLKYKQPGFEGSGGFLQGVSFGPVSDTLTGSFGLITSAGNGFAWTIASRTKTIPQSGQGNVDYLLTSGTDSKNYNKLPYFTSEKVSLSIDTTNSPSLYYTGAGTISYFSGGYFSGTIRVSPKAKEIFGNTLLCSDRNISSCDPDDDGVADDIAVNWIIDGFYSGIPFSLVPTISVFYYSGGIVDTTQDTTVRESIINQTGFLYFGDPLRGFSPIVNYSSNTLTQHNIISTDPSGVLTQRFDQILKNSSITGLKLGFGIINLLRTTNNNIHPFLEYNFSFPQPVADNFFTVQGIGLVGDYNVKIFIKKSTNEKSSIGDFTIIF